MCRRDAQVEARDLRERGTCGAALCGAGLQVMAPPASGTRCGVEKNGGKAAGVRGAYQTRELRHEDRERGETQEGRALKERDIQGRRESS